MAVYQTNSTSQTSIFKKESTCVNVNNITAILQLMAQLRCVADIQYIQMRPKCEYLRESCLCTRISGVEGVLFDWVRLSLR